MLSLIRVCSWMIFLYQFCRAIAMSNKHLIYICKIVSSTYGPEMCTLAIGPVYALYRNKSYLTSSFMGLLSMHVLLKNIKSTKSLVDRLTEILT